MTCGLAQTGLVSRNIAGRMRYEETAPPDNENQQLGHGGNIRMTHAAHGCIKRAAAREPLLFYLRVFSR